MPLSKKMMEKLGITTLANTSHKVPIKEKGDEIPHTNVYHKGSVHQADIIYLPHDKVGELTYKYALVVVDLATGLTDAEPLRGVHEEWKDKDVDKEEERSAAVALEALLIIYKRRTLNPPNRMETDPGAEFKGVFTAYLKSENIEHRFGKKGRHRQQAVVENRNHSLGLALNLRMAAIEEVTGQTSRDWVSTLPTFVKLFNDDIREKNALNKKKPVDPADKGPRCSKKGGCELLEVGTKVRVILEEPVDNVTGKQLHGKFKAGDKRWDSSHRKIYQQIIRPDMPVLYIVTKPDSEKPEKAAHTIQQLQVIGGAEKEIDARKLKIPVSNLDRQVHSINGKKTVRGVVKYHVRWVGYAQKKDWSWEPRESLMQGGAAVKKMIKDWDDA